MEMETEKKKEREKNGMGMCGMCGFIVILSRVTHSSKRRNW